MTRWKPLAAAPALVAVAHILAAPAGAQEDWDYEQVIRYMGMGCARVQADSVVRPANEIAVLVAATDLDTGYTTSVSIPGEGRYYSGVDDGDYFLGAGPIVWRGAPQSVDINVTMTEIDGGSEQTLAFTHAAYLAVETYYGGRAISATAGASARLYGRAAAGAKTLTQSPPDFGAEPNILERAVAGALDDIFGTANDLIGHDLVHVIDDDYSGGWVYTDPSTVRGTQYHFATHHRRGGADCTAYFRFEQGDLLPSYYEQSSSGGYGGGNGGGASGGYDGDLEEYYCEAGRDAYHVATDGRVYRFRGDGSAAAEGQRWSVEDPDCFAEFEMQKGSNVFFCVGDAGGLFRDNSRGGQVGQCWTCSGNDCRP